MTVVQECLGKPGKIPVTATLWGEVGPIIGFDLNTSELVSTVSATATGDDGCWSMNLVSNDDISPANTTWRVERDDFLTHKKDYVTFISVPPTGGPYEAWDLQVPGPQDIPFFIGNLEIGNSLIVNGVDMTPIALSSLLSATDPLDGDELLPMEQDNFGVKITSEKLVATPLESIGGKLRTRHKGFEDFERLTATAITVDGTIHNGGNVVYLLNGTAAQAVQDAPLGVIGAAGLQTGTSTTGRASISTASILLNLFDTTLYFAWGAIVKVPVISDGTNTYSIRMGIVDSMTAAPVDGFYFRSPAGAGNWTAVVEDDNSETTAGTGVAYDANGAYHSFVIKHIPGTGVRFWIDGSIVATITTGLPDNGAVLSQRGVGIFKSAGAVSRTVSVDAMSWDVPSNARFNNMP